MRWKPPKARRKIPPQAKRLKPLDNGFKQMAQFSKGGRVLSMVKKILFVVLIVVLLLAVCAGVLYYLATKDDNKGQYAVQPSSDLITKGIVAAGTGKEITIQQEELNGFIAYLVEQKQPDASAAFRLNSLYLTLGNEEGDAGMYAPCTYKGVDLGITARLRLTFDAEQKQMTAQFTEMKVGRLKVSPKTALSFIRQRLPQGVTVQESALLFDASLLQIQVEQLDTPLQLESFQIREGQVFVRTTGMMDAIERYIKEKLGDALGGNRDLLNGLVDNLGDLFQNFLSGL